MSGSGTCTGVEFQARVLAYIYVYVLGERRLGWFPHRDDTPRAVWAETSGPGDDIRIEFAPGLRDVEVQVKKGLSAGADLAGAVSGILARKVNSDQAVVIAVDGKCSNAIRERLPRDLLRVRTRRMDSLTKVTRDLLDALNVEPGALTSLYLETVDVLDDSDPGTRNTLHLLEDLLEDPRQAQAAWRILVTHGLADSAKRLRADRETLVGLLESAEIRLKRPDPESRVLQTLESTEALRKQYRPDVALRVLHQLRETSDFDQCSSDVLYTWCLQQAKCLFTCLRPTEALASVRIALDTRPESVEALVLHAHIQTRLGDLSSAIEAAEEALRVDPSSGDAWGALAEIKLASSEPPPHVPKSVLRSTSYMESMAQIFTEAADWLPVLDYTSQLLKAGHRRPHVLLLRSHALFCRCIGADDPDRQDLEEAVRLATEIITEVDDREAAIVRGALTVRFLSLHKAGEIERAKNDRDLLERIGLQDSDVIRVLARTEICAGRPEAALRYLENPAADSSQELLLIRAEVRTMLRDYDKARADLSRFLEIAPVTIGDHLLRIDAAERLLDLEDAQTATGVIDSIPEGVKPRHLAFLRGRALLLECAYEEAEKHYREAIRLDPDHESSFLCDLGSRLLQKSETERALRVLDEAYSAGLPDGALPMYVHALLEGRRLRDAYEIVDSLLSKEDRPTWALSIAVEIALLQEDEDRAIQILTQLASREGVTAHAGLKLCELLVESGRLDAVPTHLRAIQGRGDLTPEEIMAIAHLYFHARRSAEAFEFALRAYRADPRSQQVHRGLVQLLFLHRESIPAPETVGSNTHVVLEAEPGERVGYTVYSEGACDPTRGEIDRDTAKRLEVFGLRVGDRVILHKETLKEREYTVVEILPAIQYVAGTSAQNYEHWFPGDPDFISSFRTKPDDPSPILIPIMRSLEAKRKHVERVFEFYREKCLPLGFVASAIASPIPDVMEGLCFDSEQQGKLVVELGDAPSVSRSGRNASRIGRLVLTRSALWTASRLGVLHELAEGFTLIAPSSLKAELRAELRGAERTFSEGCSMITSTRDGRFAMPQLDPGAEELKRKLAESRELVDWCHASVQFMPRTLESIMEAGTREPELREAMGRSSYDALGLARHSGVLYCDDEGLRGLHHSEGGELSVSSLGVLSALAEQSLLDRERHFKCLAELLDWGFYAVPAQVEFLLWALRAESEVSRGLVDKAFALLGSPTTALQASVGLVVQLLRELALAPVAGPHSTRAVTSRALRALEVQWPLTLAARSVLRAAEEELSLMPTVLRHVQEVCRRALEGELLIWT